MKLKPIWFWANIYSLIICLASAMVLLGGILLDYMTDGDGRVWFNFNRFNEQFIEAVILIVAIIIFASMLAMKIAGHTKGGL